MTGTNNPTIESKSDDELEAELDALILGPFGELIINPELQTTESDSEVTLNELGQRLGTFYNIIKRIRRNLRGVEINQVNRHILNRILSLSRDLERMH
jgi:hypothetical protein